VPLSVGRRGFLLVAGGAVLTACSGGAAPVPRASTPRSSVARASTPVPSPGLPHVTRWQPGPAELVPAAKRAAVHEIERRGTGATRAVQVIDAQYGGLLPDTASVLVVCRSWRLRAGKVAPGGATYDVRVARRASGWHVTAVHPSHPGPARRPLTGRERAVLTSDRIGLPPAARADVRSGQVHPSVLGAMLAVSTAHRIEVSVVRSGHPLHVFGTTRLSDHPRGRAFDTWRVDGQPVLSADRRLVTGYMRALADAGSYNVGGPVLLGAAPQWFSDATHHDHVHAGFTT
jgi:hypothetical protein